MMYNKYLSNFSQIASRIKDNAARSSLVVAVEQGNAVINTILGVAVAARDVLVRISLKAEVAILALLTQDRREQT